MEGYGEEGRVLPKNSKKRKTPGKLTKAETATEKPSSPYPI
jgi:hypothetical protein